MLDENYAHMRMTSPRPDRYLYGQYNPPGGSHAGRGARRSGGSSRPVMWQYRNYNSGSGYAGGSDYGLPGSGLYDGLGGYGPEGEVASQDGIPGGALAPGYSLGDLPSRAEEAGGTAAGVLLAPPGGEKAAPPASLPGASPASSSAALPAPATSAPREPIDAALEDLRLGWLERDYNRLAARYPVRQPVRVFLRGEFKYQVQPSELLLMLHQAVGGVETAAFELDSPKIVEGDRVFVTGRHDWLDQQRRKQTTYVSYAFELMGGKWRIIEVGSSTSPITGHSGAQVRQ